MDHLPKSVAQNGNGSGSRDLFVGHSLLPLDFIICGWLIGLHQVGTGGRCGRGVILAHPKASFDPPSLGYDSSARRMHFTVLFGHTAESLCSLSLGQLPPNDREITAN